MTATKKHRQPCTHECTHHSAPTLGCRRSGGAGAAGALVASSDRLVFATSTVFQCNHGWQSSACGAACLGRHVGAGLDRHGLPGRAGTCFISLFLFFFHFSDTELDQCLVHASFLAKTAQAYMRFSSVPAAVVEVTECNNLWQSPTRRLPVLIPTDGSAPVSGVGEIIARLRQLVIK